MPAIVAITATDQVLDQLALTVAEDTYTIAAPADDSAMRPGGLSSANVILSAELAWQYSHKTGGPWFTVGPYQFLPLRGVGTGRILYVKAVAGTPTLSAMVTPRP